MAKKDYILKTESAPEFRMPFGKYKGQPLSALPHFYRQWLKTQDWIKYHPALASALKVHAHKAAAPGSPAKASVRHQKPVAHKPAPPATGVIPAPEISSAPPRSIASPETVREIEFAGPAPIPAKTSSPSAKEWTPRVPLSAVAQSSKAKAVKLQAALARALALYDNKEILRSQIEQLALDDYEKYFGHRITDRTIRALLKRTRDRAGASPNFDRLEIYLPENPTRKDKPKPIISLVIESQFAELHAHIHSFTNPAAPSLTEKQFLWLRSFELHDEQIANGKADKKVRRNLIKFLTRNAPFLASPDCLSVANQIRCAFYRKYDKWIESDRDAKALADLRAENSGRFRCPEFTAADKDKLIAHAVFNCGGRVAQAWRELNERRELSEQITSYYLANPKSISYVPRSILDSVKREVAMQYDIHHGPRQAKLNGAHIFRDWSTVRSLDWWQGDDTTAPVYMRVVNEQGQTVLMRGQTLLMIDLRTTRILGFVLIPETSYTANAIRTLITQIADEYGLPRKGFYFEHGTWKAKLLAGERDKEALSWPETQQGLKEFGLRFVHAGLPRAKPVERTIGALQNLMEGLPAYVGRNEMIEKFERTQKALALAKKGDPAALAQIMDHAEWCQVLQTICEKYNAARQGGKMTGGLSPNEAFEQFANLADPPVKFSGDCRYLLAHQRRAVRVTKNGITFQLNNETFNFRSSDTGPLIGQTVLTWFNPELPELLTVTDMHRKNPFTIARTQEVPAMDAPPELLAQELARCAAHNAYAKARYKVLKPLKPIAFRGMIADRDTVELGAEIGAQRSAELHRIGEQTRIETKTRKAARKLGIAVPADRLNRPEAAPALDRLNELLESEEETL